LEANLLINQINSPAADAIVVDGNQLGVSGVEEFNLIGYVHTDWVSADCFSSLDIPNDELTVVLTTE